MGNERYIINRLTVLDLYEGMLGENGDYRILRILGKANMGKTHLLREFRRRAVYDHNLKLGSVVLGEELSDAQSILLSLRNQLSDFKFDHYTQAINSHLISQAGIQDTNVLWSNVSISVEVQKNKDEKRRQFTLAFIEDLKANESKKLLFCIDTVDQVEHLHDWIQHELLSGICQLKNVFVVMAGRSMPKIPVSLEWHCKDHELKPLKYHHYEEFREREKADISDEILQACYTMFDGKPGELASAIVKLKGDS